jgi:hypothetical protein
MRIVPRSPKARTEADEQGSNLNRPEEAIAVVPNAIEGSSQPKTYVGLQARPPKNEDDPGEIMEAWFYVENGKVVLTDGTHQQLARQRLSEGQDPADWRGNCSGTRPWGRTSIARWNIRT